MGIFLTRGSQIDRFNREERIRINNRERGQVTRSGRNAPTTGSSMITQWEEYSKDRSLQSSWAKMHQQARVGPTRWSEDASTTGASISSVKIIGIIGIIRRSRFQQLQQLHNLYLSNLCTRRNYNNTHETIGIATQDSNRNILGVSTRIDRRVYSRARSVTFGILPVSRRGNL
jgi:hypothetical protein